LTGADGVPLDQLPQVVVVHVQVARRWAIDAGIGIYALTKLFSGPSDTELAGRAAEAQWESDVWNGLSAAQQAEANGAGWSNPKDAGALIWMRTLYQKMGRANPEASAEAFMQGVWGAEKNGPDAVISAVKNVQGFKDGGLVRGPAGSPQAVIAHAGEVVLNTAQQQNVAGALASTDVLGHKVDALHATMKQFLRTQPVLLRHALRGA